MLGLSITEWICIFTSGQFYWLSDFLSGSMISFEGTVAAGEPRLHRLYPWFDPESAAVRSTHSSGGAHLHFKSNY